MWYTLRRSSSALIQCKHISSVEFAYANYFRYIFQNLYAGGDLHSFWEFQNYKIPNNEAAFIVYQILKAVDYLHAYDIVHRDLKLENVLMTSFTDTARIVLTDFGAAIQVPRECRVRGHDGARMFSITGTYEYMAP
jgi:serine/threonine protein kinase